MLKRGCINTTLLTRFAEELSPSPRLRRTCRRAPKAGGKVQMYESANVVIGPMVFVGDKAIWA